MPTSAEEWLARLLSPDCSSREHAEFEDWLASNPSNAVAYAETERLHAAVAALREDAQLGKPLIKPQEVHHLPTPTVTRRQSDRRRQRRALPAMALAASVALAVGIFTWIRVQTPSPSDSVRYATAVGEQETVQLPDGSALVLDTNTVVVVSFERSLRHLELQHGRLQANVAKDPNRPFEVVSGAGSVRALGTTFQVEDYGGETLVRLIEGRVAVKTHHDGRRQAVELQPMQTISYSPSGRLSSPRTLDADYANGWLSGKLVFKEQPLSDLLTEVNRYSSSQISIADDALKNVRISGIFDARDQTALIQSLRLGWNIRAKQAGEKEIYLYAGDQ